MDKHITAVFVGFLFACTVIILTTQKKEPVSTCYAYIRDTNGNIHVMAGVKSNE